MSHPRNPAVETKITAKSRPSSVTSKGQATIPADIRRHLHIEPGDKVSFAIEDGRAVLEKVHIIDHVWNDGQSLLLSEWNDDEQDIYNDD